MCRQDWCLGALHDFTLGFLDCVITGETSEQALCGCLGSQFDASATAHVLLDRRTSTAVVRAWPATLDLPCLRDALYRLPHLLPELLGHVVSERRASCLSASVMGSGSTAGVVSLLVHDSLGYGDLAQVPIEVPGPVDRFAVLARNRPFDSQDMHVLKCLRELLGTLIRIAECPAAPAPRRMRPRIPGSRPGRSRCCVWSRRATWHAPWPPGSRSRRAPSISISGAPTENSRSTIDSRRYAARRGWGCWVRAPSPVPPRGRPRS
jgi:hypothetical protein